MTRALRTISPLPERHSIDFDAFLAERGIFGKVKAAVNKRVIAYQLDERRVACGMSKIALAQAVGTSRTQIDRILDPNSQNITLETLNRVAEALGKRVHFELVD